MANTHPANLGDVLKHLFLCEALDAKPHMYLESHAGAFSYDLATVPDPGPGGIWDFADMAGADSTLGESTYARIAVPLAGTPESPGTYLGSVGLAHEVLMPTTMFVLAEKNEDTAAALEDALAERSGSPHVMTYPFDGQDVVANMAGPGALVLIDPFDVHAESEIGLSSIEAFCRSVKKGAATYLWYPLVEQDEGTPWISEVLGAAGIWPLQLEIRYPEKCAGLWGCGIIANGVTPNTYFRITALWSSLTRELLATGTEYSFFTMG